MRYEPSPADRAPLPAGYAEEPRYLKYRDSDASRPYAKYFRASTRPVPEEVVQALVGGMAPTEYGYGVREAAIRLARPGYEGLENGWTRLSDGVVMVGCLTDMPGVTAEMWDWWFGWHSRESARYKLWYPDAHQYAGIGEDRSADRELTDRQRYIGNVSYVDEYIGGHLQRLAIRFVDPEDLGVRPVAGTTHICARVTLSSHPIAIGWLIHQVRPTEHGAEMRSRFFLNDPGVLELPPHSLPATPASRVLTTSVGRRIVKAALPVIVTRMVSDTLGSDMLHHCSAEMNHLAAFLPQLYEEFRDTP
ncbi:DAPG hydrolase family protein [Streptomyces sp. NPDC058867]|uniref:DAPG hydrolase family protein n=1 Tax=unclassified Streptomyces TaxID=2593676 RepID=UPI0036C98D00